MNNSKNSHSWHFFRAGGFDQVLLKSGADLISLDQLDQKLWVALACPTTGLEFDSKTLALIDTDKDGRIRAPELIAAVKWVGSLIKNPDELLKGPAALPLASINDAHPEGKVLLASARQILVNLGKKDATAITSEDVADTAKVFAQTVLNGDGIIVADTARDESTKAIINDIINTLGSDMDRSGKPGITQAKVDQFFAELTAFSDWHKKAETEAAAILPLGSGTPGASEAVKAVKAKVDDYFARCRLAAFDPRALAALNREEKEYLALAAKDLSITAQEVAGFPLAGIQAGKPLPLREGINPAWAAAMAALHTNAVKPILGDKTMLTEADWTAINAELGPYECWCASKAGSAGEKLGLARSREILAGKAKEAITRLIVEDKALEPEANAIAGVDKLVRLYQHIYLLCTNFVNFRDFYDAGEPAIFQQGTLYLDQRSCTLTLPVDDAGRHAAMAGLAGTYLAYCDCVRKATGERRTIVAAFTNGDSDNLMIGRNGLFYDRTGRDWDATITKIVDNPISIRQAFWSPYKKLVRLIEEQVAKRAAAAEAASDAKVGAAATTVATADKAKPAEPRKMDVGTVAALGVAFGALATAFAAIAGYFSGMLKLPFWQVCLAVVGLLLLISGPFMLIAWLKLRKRNLGPILDANGWAVNAKAKVNVPFGTTLTGIARLPPGSTHSTEDRFGERPSAWPKIALFIIVVSFIYSLLNHFYLVDKIVFKATGQHWGKQAPSQPNKVPGGDDPAGTNAPPATP